MALKKNPKLLLVEGCPRSGTGILRHVLNTHWEIAITHELNLLKTGEDLFRARLEEEFSNKTELRYVGDKVPDYIFDHRRLRRKFPDLRILCIIRNPLGVLNSMMFRRRMSEAGHDPTWNRFLSVRDGIAYWKYCWNLLTEDNSILPLKYEDLLQNPDTEMGKVASFLGLGNSFDARVMKTLLKPNTQSSLSIAERRLIEKHLGEFIALWDLPIEHLRAKCRPLTKPIFLKARIRAKALLYKAELLRGKYKRGSVVSKRG